MNKHLVSVIMPYYKKKLFFKKAYNSVRNQTYPLVEVIVIFDDNNSQELEFLKEIISQDKKTKLFVNLRNCGVSFSRNLGIKKSSGKYVAFLDCDDVWNKKKLEKQIEFMIKNKYKISHTAYNFIDKNDKNIGKFVLKKKLNYISLLNSCDVGLSTVIIEKKILGTNPFPKISSKEDYVLWLKLIKKFKFGYLNERLTSWRMLKNSLSGNFIKKIKNAFLVYYKFEKISFFKSILRVLILSYCNIGKK